MPKKQPAEDHPDIPTLNRAIDRYIRTVIDIRLKAAGQRSPQDKIADGITAFSGHMVFVYVSIVWFAAWILLNSGLLPIRPFDPYPYGLLTMIVSLEAIFLSTFILISQNRMNEQAEHRADLDLQIDLRPEYELTRVLQMLDAIQDELGIENAEDTELAELETGTKPEDVLAENERLQQRALRRRRPSPSTGSA